MGWFFGFKLHLICNEKGELLNFMITPGDIDDRKPLEYKAFVDFIYGKLVGDKGYIGKNLFDKLFVDGIQLITKLKSNMKGSIMKISDRLLLITMNLRILHRWNIPDTDLSTTSLSILLELWQHIASFLRNLQLPFKGLLIDN